MRSGAVLFNQWLRFCFLQLSKTNFSNNNDFRSFLQSLCATFKEFKMHEQIENEYIISLLQERCRTVYNVHSDNKLSEMLSLFEKGLHSIKVNMYGGNVKLVTLDAVGVNCTCRTFWNGSAEKYRAALGSHAWYSMMRLTLPLE